MAGRDKTPEEAKDLIYAAGAGPAAAAVGGIVALATANPVAGAIAAGVVGASLEALRQHVSQERESQTRIEYTKVITTLHRNMNKLQAEKVGWEFICGNDFQPLLIDHLELASKTASDLKVESSFNHLLNVALDGQVKYDNNKAIEEHTAQFIRSATELEIIVLLEMPPDIKPADAEVSLPTLEEREQQLAKATGCHDIALLAVATCSLSARGFVRNASLWGGDVKARGLTSMGEHAQRRIRKSPLP